jgi:hypothetical protein
LIIHFNFASNQPRFRVKGIGVKGKTNPETEPDFYSMPFVKADDTSTTSRRDLEDIVAVELEEKCKCSDPAPCWKKRVVKMMNYREHVVGDDAFSSQENASLAVGIPSIAAPIEGTKKTRPSDPSSSFHFSSSTTVYTFSRHMSEGNDFRYLSPVPHSEDTYDRVPRSGNKSPFGMSLSENSLSALQSLQDHILSPSSSSFLLDEMFQRR